MHTSKRSRKAEVQYWYPIGTINVLAQPALFGIRTLIAYATLLWRLCIVCGTWFASAVSSTTSPPFYCCDDYVFMRYVGACMEDSTWFDPGSCTAFGRCLRRELQGWLLWVDAFDMHDCALSWVWHLWLKSTWLPLSTSSTSPPSYCKGACGIRGYYVLCATLTVNPLWNVCMQCVGLAWKKRFSFFAIGMLLQGYVCSWGYYVCKYLLWITYKGWHSNRLDCLDASPFLLLPLIDIIIVDVIIIKCYY